MVQIAGLLCRRDFRKHDFFMEFANACSVPFAAFVEENRNFAPRRMRLPRYIAASVLVIIVLLQQEKPIQSSGNESWKGISDGDRFNERNRLNARPGFLEPENRGLA
jgi:hypothetical protein